MMTWGMGGGDLAFNYLIHLIIFIHLIIREYIFYKKLVYNKQVLKLFRVNYCLPSSLRVNMVDLP